VLFKAEKKTPVINVARTRHDPEEKGRVYERSDVNKKSVEKARGSGTGREQAAYGR